MDPQSILNRLRVMHSEYLRMRNVYLTYYLDSDLAEDFRKSTTEKLNTFLDTCKTYHEVAQEDIPDKNLEDLYQIEDRLRRLSYGLNPRSRIIDIKIRDEPESSSRKRKHYAEYPIREKNES